MINNNKNFGSWLEEMYLQNFLDVIQKKLCKD
jgi:hypothetical protein